MLLAQQHGVQGSGPAPRFPEPATLTRVPHTCRVPVPLASPQLSFFSDCFFSASSCCCLASNLFLWYILAPANARQRINVFAARIYSSRGTRSRTCEKKAAVSTFGIDKNRWFLHQMFTVQLLHDRHEARTDKVLSPCRRQSSVSSAVQSPLLLASRAGPPLACRAGNPGLSQPDCTCLTAQAAAWSSERSRSRSRGQLCSAADTGCHPTSELLPLCLQGEAGPDLPSGAPALVHKASSWHPPRFGSALEGKINTKLRTTAEL